MAVSITKFELFPKLPPEIRLQIWSYLHGPRIVELSYRDGIFACNKGPPPLLQICQETKKEFLGDYTLQLKTADPKSPIFIDPAHDLVHLNNASDPFFDKLFGVSHLALDGVLDEQPSLLSEIWGEIHRFQGLETLTIVLHGRDCNSNRFSTNLDQRLSFVSSRIEEMQIAGEIQDPLQLHSSLRLRESRLMEEFAFVGNRWLDETMEFFPKWRRPQLRLVCLEVDGARCCHLDTRASPSGRLCGHNNAIE